MVDGKDDLDFSDTIAPKSDQLNADDLLLGPIDVLITGVVDARPSEQPIIIKIEGHQPYKPCKGMRRVIFQAWSTKARTWIGRRMRLYCNPAVTYGPDAVGGIEISHMSDIASAFSLMLTVKRGKKKKHTVNPLPLANAETPLEKSRKRCAAWASQNGITEAQIEEAIGKGIDSADMDDMKALAEWWANRQNENKGTE